MLRPQQHDYFSVPPFTVPKCSAHILISHLQETENVLARDEPVGRRLDFLMQELNREANTLGSKSAHPATSAAAVDLKVLIEQMREQVQNIE